MWSAWHFKNIQCILYTQQQKQLRSNTHTSRAVMCPTWWLDLMLLLLLFFSSRLQNNNNKKKYTVFFCSFLPMS